jgi:hypothetical protein
MKNAPKRKYIQRSNEFDIKEPKEGDLCISFYSRYRLLQAYKQLLNIIVIHIANEHISSKAYTMKLLRMGLMPGTPDYWVGIKGGGSFFIEFKRNSKCKQTDKQKSFELLITEMGFPYYLVWDVDIAMDLLTTYNIKAKG